VADKAVSGAWALLENRALGSRVGVTQVLGVLMLHRFVAPVVGLLLGLQPVYAQTAPTDPAQADVAQTQAAELYTVLRLPEILQVMREEGISYGAKIGADLFPVAIDPDWSAQVELIYDTAAMRAQSETAFAKELEGTDIPAMLAFFGSEPGRSFSSLEVSARRAQLDEAVEAASREAAAVAMADNSPRYQLIMRFVEANDLIETNVVGALNSNYAFYQGLMEGGAAEPGLTDDEILANVWDQEPEIRRTTTEWVMSFLLMAYEPLSDADLEAYIAFSETPAGADLNRAVFDAFDQMFIDISRALGRASAKYMIGATL
jgi:hypothetical protein